LLQTRLQICCSGNAKTEDSRRKWWQFAADSLQIHQTGRGGPGFLRIRVVAKRANIDAKKPRS
jgi:hypothetical protein